MPGLRLFRSLAAIGAGVLLAIFAVDAAGAQTAFGPPVGLRDSIDENPGPASRRRSERRRGAIRRDARPSVPAYGNPPGSGAGATGFISTNLPPANRPRLSPLPRGVLGARAQANGSLARPGSPATGPTRPGVSIDLPPGAATPLIRRRKPLVPEEDPFEPLGIRAGRFILKPAVETIGGYDSNPNRSSRGRGSAYITVAPELQVRSDFSRHALNADLRGSYSAYKEFPELDRPFFDGRVNGRVDVTRQTRIDLEARGIVSTDNPGSPDLPAGLARLPIYTTIGTTAGVTHQFNRFEIGGKGSFDRVTYENSLLDDGSTVSNRDRNYNQYAAQLRAAYELTPGMKPFVEGTFDTRERDLPVDSFGIRRDSNGVTGRVGTTFEFSRKLTGEIGVGYLVRTYKDPSLPDLTGLIVDGSLIWTATGLTTLRLTAKSSADESTLPGVAGVLRRDFGLQVDHAFRRWLIGTARIGYGLEDYQGSTREDTRYVAAAAITYKLNRSMQVKGELRQEWLRSNIPDNDYTASIALVGLRLQR